MTNSAGSVCFSADYYPFGQENDYNTSCSTTYKLTGYEFDSETVNDYAYARYYNPRLGRFMSPDPLGGSVLNPQSLNRYTYVLDNPESLVDPWGLCVVGTPPPDSGSYSVGANDSTTIRVVGYTVCSPDLARLEWDGSPYPGSPTPPPDTVLYSVRLPGDLPVARARQPQTRNQAAINLSAESTCGAAPPMLPSAPDPYGPFETYLYINAQAMFQNGGSGPWGQDVRGCLACMHSQGASMSTSHRFCYLNGSVRTGPLQSVEGLSQAIWAATQTGLRQLSLVPWPGTPPFMVVYSPVPWR